METKTEKQDAHQKWRDMGNDSRGTSPIPYQQLYTECAGQTKQLVKYQRRLDRIVLGIQYPLAQPAIAVFERVGTALKREPYRNAEQVFSQELVTIQALTRGLERVLEDSEGEIQKLSNARRESYLEAIKNVNYRKKSSSEMDKLWRELDRLETERGQIEDPLTIEAFKCDEKISKLGEKLGFKYADLSISTNATAYNLCNKDTFEKHRELHFAHYLLSKTLIEQIKHYQTRLEITVPSTLRLIEAERLNKALVEEVGALTRMSESISDIAYNGVSEMLQNIRRQQRNLYHNASDKLGTVIGQAREGITQMNEEAEYDLRGRVLSMKGKYKGPKK